MTRERTHTYELADPSLIQLLLEAVLCAFASLVQGVVATLGMRFNRKARDWHTTSPQEALPPAKLDTQLKDPTTPTASFSGLTRESLLDPTRELADDPRDASNRDLRDKPEGDTGDVAASSQPLAALMVSSARRARPSNHEGGLTGLSPLIPANAGIQGGSQGVSRLAAAAPRTSHNRSWMPTFVGMSGELSA